MKEILTIASFNTQNPNMKKEKNDQQIIEKLVEIIKKEEIDLLCCQEVLESTVEKLKSKLPDYKIVSFYRYGNNFTSKNITILKKYNEATPIITRLQILKESYHNLPWIPRKIGEIKNGILKYRSITPRLITEAILKIEGQFVKVLSVHLEKRILTVKKRQLKKIERVVKKSMCPVILAGDFNMGTDDILLKEFEKKLQNKNLKRVEWNHKTWKYSKKDIAIDHIFIPNDFSVIEQKIIENRISDHYMILIKVITNL